MKKNTISIILPNFGGGGAERAYLEIAKELAPDPLNVDRLILNRLFHQTPDFPDKKNIN